MMLPGVSEMASEALVKTFGVDTLPELQYKTKSNSTLLEKTLIKYVDQPNWIELVN